LLSRRRPGRRAILVAARHLLHPGIPAQQGWDGAEVTQVTGAGMHPVAAKSRKAIAPAPLSPGDLGQRLGRLADKARRRKGGG